MSAQLNPEQAVQIDNSNKRALARKQEAELAKLIAYHDINGLTKFAIYTDNSQLAIKAVFPIITDDSIPNKLDIYRQLAQSDSHAAGLGMNGLFLSSNDTRDHEIFFDRLRKGDICRLWNSKKMTALDLGILLADEAGAGNKLSRIMEALDKHPDIKSKVCQELLKKDTLDNYWIINNAPDCLRLECLKYLIDKKLPGYEIVLSEIAIQGKPELADPAQLELEIRWTSEKQKPATEQSISELLIGSRLQQMANQLATMHWSDGRDDAPSLYSQWLEADVEAIEIKQNAKARKRANELRKDLDTIKTKREEFLNKNIDKVLDGAGLRLPRLNFKIIQPIEIEEFESLASYDFGNGEIRITEDRAMSNTYLDPYLCNTVTHELTHHEQNCLMIRALADELENHKQIKISATSNDTIKNELNELYRTRIGFSITSDFLDKVLLGRDKALDNRHLTPGEAKRAAALIEVLHDKSEAVPETFRISQNINMLHLAIAQLDKEIPIHLLLQVKEDQREAELQQLLGVNKLPDDIRQDFKSLKQAEKNGATNAKELNTALRKKLREEFIGLKDELTDKQTSIYEARLHEQEAHAVERRAFFFAQLCENRRGITVLTSNIK